MRISPQLLCACLLLGGPGCTRMVFIPADDARPEPPADVSSIDGSRDNGGADIASPADQLASDAADASPTIDDLAVEQDAPAQVDTYLQADLEHARAEQLALAGPGVITAGGCAQYTLATHDGSGKAIPVTTARTFALAANGDALLFTDSDCSISTAQVEVAAGASSVSFFLRDTRSEEVTLGASDPLELLQGTSLALTVTPAAPDPGAVSIAGTGPVVADGQSTSTITIALADGFGNALPGITPTFDASGEGNSYGPCSATDSAGVSTCTLSSTQAGSKTLALLTPVAATGGTVEFTAIPVSGCGGMGLTHATYLLTEDLAAQDITAKCFNLSGDHVTLDCQGHALLAPSLEAAVIYASGDHVTIRNCEVTASSYKPPASGNGSGVAVDLRGDYGLVENVTATNSFWGIHVSGHDNVIQNNHVEGNAKGIHIGGNDNVVKNNLCKNNNKYQSWGLAVWNGYRNRFENNKVYGSSYGLVLKNADFADVWKCGVLSGTIYEYPDTTDVTYHESCPAAECTWVGDVCQ